jgi:hypothetical protein
LAACLRRRKFHAAFRPHLHDYYLVSMKMLFVRWAPDAPLKNPHHFETRGQENIL